MLFAFKRASLHLVDLGSYTLTRNSLKCATETQSVIRFLNITHRHCTRGRWQETRRDIGPQNSCYTHTHVAAQPRHIPQTTFCVQHVPNVVVAFSYKLSYEIAARARDSTSRHGAERRDSMTFS